MAAKKAGCGVLSARRQQQRRKVCQPRRLRFGFSFRLVGYRRLALSTACRANAHAAARVRVHDVHINIDCTHRAFIESRLPNFVADNPQVEVEVVKRGAKHPYVRGHYGQCVPASTNMPARARCCVSKRVFFYLRSKRRRQVGLREKRERQRRVRQRDVLAQPKGAQTSQTSLASDARAVDARLLAIGSCANR